MCIYSGALTPLGPHKVSLFRRLISTVVYYIGTLGSVPIMEVSLFQSVLIAKVPLYIILLEYVFRISFHQDYNVINR